MNFVDHVLYNANIITLNQEQPRASALAISAGRIVALGSDDDILPLAGSDTARHNLNGMTVIPGLTDAHIHWEWTSRGLYSVDVFAVPSKEVAVERVAEWAGKTPAGEWLRGSGWFQDLWPDRAFPSAADLDNVAPHHPVYLTAKSGHAAWVNSVALARCGITADTLDPEGGQI